MARVELRKLTPSGGNTNILQETGQLAASRTSTGGQGELYVYQDCVPVGGTCLLILCIVMETEQDAASVKLAICFQYCVYGVKKGQLVHITTIMSGARLTLPSVVNGLNILLLLLFLSECSPF